MGSRRQESSAIEDGVEQVALVADATLESDKDPFDSDSDDAFNHLIHAFNHNSL